MLRNPFHMPHTILCLATAACLLLSACVASTQKNGSTTGTAPTATSAPFSIMMTMAIYEGVLAFPTPHWVTTIKDLGNIKTFRNQNTTSYTFEQIPKDQELENWSTLYGIYGWQKPGYDMPHFIAESTDALAKGCKTQARIKQITSGKDKVIATFDCDTLVDGLVKDGKDSESGVLLMTRTGNSYVRVYQAWRAPSQDRNTPAWPADEATLTANVERMQRITYTPRK